MKLLLLVLLSVLSYQCCTGYPVVQDDILTENGTSIEFWLDASNKTAFNDSSPLDMHGFFKKVGDKVKDKMKDGFNKVKDKYKDCKDILEFLTFSVAREISEDILSENGSSIEYWFNAPNGTAFNDTSTLDMHGFFKKVADKVKDKMKDGFNKVKDKIKDCRDILKLLTFSVAEEISEDILSENGTYIKYSFNAPNGTTFNDSSPKDMHGFGKKVVNKVKDGIKTAKDGLNKVKDKMKDGYNKLKDKVNNFKDKIGSKGGSGGGSGGGYYRDNYDRDYNRDKYDRDYNRDKYGRDYDHKDRKYSGGGGVSDPNALWILGAFGILMLVSVVVGAIYYNCKK